MFEAGARRGLFLSAQQRSLINEPALTARPWWTAEQTQNAAHLRVSNVCVSVPPHFRANFIGLRKHFTLTTYIKHISQIHLALASLAKENIRFSKILRNDRRNFYKSCASTSYNFPCNCAICRRVSLNAVYESLYKIRIVLYHDTPVRKINLCCMWNFRIAANWRRCVIFFCRFNFYFSHC